VAGVYEYLLAYSALLRAVDKYNVVTLIGQLYYWHGSLTSDEYDEFVAR